MSSTYSLFEAAPVVNYGYYEDRKYKKSNKK